ncbi:DUF4386 domain-containing protein [Candidatus Chloroploca sp. Khr17]|uniref:DUF4386 domain-containing protein n=1 Tax=Candidatus Chloroploca sp. Khr17 TaxID=2496869 RepID=UPI00101C44BD|nr:DUF4386 domain-containing protein [Candidatus Chloroploca sp. Khr17]
MATTQKPNTHTRTARVVGALFLLATVTYMTGTGLIESLLTGSDYLLHIYPNQSQLIGGVLLQFVDAAAVVGIGVLLVPIVKRQSEPIALGYVATRILECVFLVVGGIAILALIGVSQATIQAGAPDTAARTLGALLVDARTTAYHIAMAALGLGSLPFCYVLYRSRLIPRWLSLLGLIGYAALLIGSVLEIFGQDLQLIHNLPGGIFELILPIWLIVKGFNLSVSGSDPANSERNERTGMPISRA